MISERLKELRVKNKKTQQDLANLLGISRQGYSKYENGKSVPDANMLNTLSDFYNVSSDFILCRELPNQKNSCSILENSEDLNRFISELINSKSDDVNKLVSIWNIIKEKH